MKLNWEEIPETLIDYHCGGWFISPQIFTGLCTRRKCHSSRQACRGASAVAAWGCRQEGTRGWLGKERRSRVRGVQGEPLAVMPARSWGPSLCSGSFCSTPTCCQGRSSSLGRARSWNPNTRAAVVSHEQTVQLQCYLLTQASLTTSPKVAIFFI